MINRKASEKMLPPKLLLIKEVIKVAQKTTVQKIAQKPNSNGIKWS